MTKLDENHCMAEEDDTLFQFLSPGVVYRPCKYCKSLNYDFGTGDPFEDAEGNTIFEPDTCDQCDTDLILPGSIKFH